MVMEISPGNHRPPQQKGVPCRHFLIFGATKKALKTRYMLGCLPTQDHNDKQDDFTMYRNPITRWWQLKCFLFSSRFCGEMIQFDEHIVQMGWNHHVDKDHEMNIKLHFQLLLGGEASSLTYCIWMKQCCFRFAPPHSPKVCYPTPPPPAGCGW